jgi:hypothetical protein
MSWGQPATVATAAMVFATCEAPNCAEQALLIVSFEGEHRKSCANCAKNVPIVGAIENAPFNELARDLLLKAWEAAKLTLDAAKNTEMDIRKAVAGYVFTNPKEGVNHHDLGGGYGLKLGHKLNYKIAASNEAVDKAEDEASKCGNEGTFLFERIITWTPNFSKSEYNKLEAEANPTHAAVKKLVDGLIEITTGAPSLEIKEPKAKLNA